MPIILIAIIVLVAWGIGAAAGSASAYLVGAVVGVVVALALLALYGGIVAKRHPSDREVPGPPRS